MTPRERYRRLLKRKLDRIRWHLDAIDDEAREAGERTPTGDVRGVLDEIERMQDHE